MRGAVRFKMASEEAGPFSRQVTALNWPTFQRCRAAGPYLSMPQLLEGARGQPVGLVIRNGAPQPLPYLLRIANLLPR